MGDCQLLLPAIPFVLYMEKMNLRKAYDEALAEARNVNKNIVVLDADFSQAAEFALNAKIPFIEISTAGKTFEQIRSSIAIPKANVKIVDLSCNLSDQYVEDLNIIRAMPGMTVLNPVDAIELKKMMSRIIEYQGPVYLRINRNDLPVCSSAGENFEIGKIYPLTDGKDMAIFATGFMVSKAMEAAHILNREGLYAQVLNVSTLKPLNREDVLKYAQWKKAVICAEESVKTGGLGQAIASILLGKAACTFELLAIDDVFGTPARDYDELLIHYGLSTEDICNAARRLLQKKLGFFNISISGSEQKAIDKTLSIIQKITRKS